MKREFLALALLLGCSGANEPDEEGPPAPLHVSSELAELPTREEQHERLCATPRGDAFHRAVCGGERPKLGDLKSLIALSGLAENSAFALTGNSTSLVMLSVSALNPRVILFPRVDESLTRPPEFTAIGFVRGEQFVELVSRDTERDDLNFYLVTFERACDYDAAGCDLASLLTEEIEHGWTEHSIYTEDDLANTSLDCRSCHQPGGAGTKKILRMQELENPWLHWFPQRFAQRTESDRVLTAQFMELHGLDSQYGGVPIEHIESAIDAGSAAQLEAALRAEGHGNQPNAFDPRIESEAKEVGASPTWQVQFELVLRGEAIPVPYPLVDVTDPAKRAAAVASYRDVVSGAAPRESLVDIRDVFSADALEKLSVSPAPSAGGRTILLQMCSRCHDGRGGPELSRSNFDVRQLDSMSRIAKDTAIARLLEPASSPLKMPPWRSGRLSEVALELAIEELKR
jgi:hypothetical protein